MVRALTAASLYSDNAEAAWFMECKTMDYEDNRGRLFVQNQDSTISPMFARHLVLAAWNDERAII